MTARRGSLSRAQRTELARAGIFKEALEESCLLRKEKR